MLSDAAVPELSHDLEMGHVAFRTANATFTGKAENLDVERHPQKRRLTPDDVDALMDGFPVDFVSAPECSRSFDDEHEHCGDRGWQSVGDVAARVVRNLKAPGV